MNTELTLAEKFLRALQEQEVQVSIFLVNGIKLHGVINHYDEHTIFLKGNVTQMIFKHSVSTVVPSKAIDVD